MATGKRYYWMKLKEGFMTSDTVDYFMSQPDGANYVVLYQMLCLKTINTEGRLSRQIGEVVIPFDVEKIQRDCKWFSIDTIRVALKLYQSFGLVYEDVDGVLVLSDHSNLVGSETDWAEKKRKQQSKKEPDCLPAVDKGGENFPQHVPRNVPIDNRERGKILDNRVVDNRVVDVVAEGNGNGNNEDADSVEEAVGSSTLEYMGGTLGKGVVLLTEAQIDALLEELGFDAFNHYVEKLANFIIDKEAKVGNHYATILKWAKEDMEI